VDRPTRPGLLRLFLTPNSTADYLPFSFEPARLPGLAGAACLPKTFMEAAAARPAWFRRLSNFLAVLDTSSSDCSFGRRAGSSTVGVGATIARPSSRTSPALSSADRGERRASL
jgi:hypothetical protein